MRLVRKVFADLWYASGRSALVVIAIATGLFAVVCVSSTNAILSRELKRSFAAITPASAIIRTSKVTLATLDSLSRIAGVRIVDGAAVFAARARVGETYKPILLYTVADFDHIKINKLRSMSGAWPPAAGTILLERSAVRVARVESGGALNIQLANHATASLKVAGTVHDFSQAPAWQEGAIYGYVSRETMSSLSGDVMLSDVRIVVAEPALDIANIRTVAQRVASSLEHSGHVVRDIQIPKPGEHPHQVQMNSLLSIQEAFGAVTLSLSGALIVVLLTALLVQHKRQIGAMKAIGASRASIFQMYALWIFVLAGCAEIVAIPLGLAAGRAYAAFIAEMLNFDIVSGSVPFVMMVGLVLLGGLLPLLFAFIPIMRASGMTTRAALSDQAPLHAWSPSVGGFRPFNTQTGRLAAIGLANSLRVRSRFALVVATLSVGGALFLAALNLGRSFSETLAVNFERMGFDIALDVNGNVAMAPLDSSLRAIPGVTSVDVIARLRATVATQVAPAIEVAALHDAGVFGGFALSGTNATSRPPNLDSVTGRWFVSTDRNTVVANHVWLIEHPGIAVGDSVTLRIDGDTSRFLLAGVVREVFVGGQVYMRNEVVGELARDIAHNTQIQIITSRHDNGSIAAVIAHIERKMTEQGIGVRRLAGLQNIRQAREDHLLVIVSFLVAVASLSMIVGGLGLATMLSVAIFERSQEIGVMRAIGATRIQLLIMIVVEGLCIALAGGIGSIVLAVPATLALDNRFGNMMLGTPLDFHLSPTAIPWLALVTTIIALAASSVPAWRASEQSTRELLVST